MSSTGHGELWGDPVIQNSGLMLYDQSNTTRTQHHPQFTPIQEGAVLGQAHYPRDIISPDRTDQDGFESIQSINEARRPDDIAASVYGQHMQYGQPPTTQGGHQDRIVQPASASSSHHTDYRSHDSPQQSTGNHQSFIVNLPPQQPTGNHQSFIVNLPPQQSTGNHQSFIVNLPPQQPTGNHQTVVGNSPTYAQSVSGFSSYAMNISSDGHLQPLPGSFEPPMINWPSPLADQHVSSTHEALRRGLYTQMGHSMYTNHWNFCFNSMISAGHDKATAKAFANNMLYYPDGRPVLKCLLCQHEHDEGSPFGHVATCIVQQCLISMTMNHNNIQGISPRCRLAEGTQNGEASACDNGQVQDRVPRNNVDRNVMDNVVHGIKNPQSRNQHLDLKERPQKEKHACSQQSKEVQVRAECIDQLIPAPMSTLGNEYRTANVMPEARRDHSAPREQLDQAGTIQTRTTLPKLSAGRSQTCINSNLNNYVTAIQTIDPSSLQNPAAASDISPPQTPGRKKIEYPSYADRQNRIRSFENWPTSSKQSPKRLATAGFYYTGTSDHCRCFYCGGLLRDWEDSDDPMKEHQDWFPDCPFVLDAKNVDCNTRTSTDKDVTNVKERNQRKIEAIEHGVTKLSLQERDVPGCGNVQTLVDMGFAREAVVLAAQSLAQNDSFDDLLNVLLKQNSTTGNDTVYIPPAMDANICGGCNRNEIAVTQYRCGHIVCRECTPRKDSKGNFPCCICGKEVTKVVAIDSSAFKN